MPAVVTRLFDNPGGQGLVDLVREEQRVFLAIAGDRTFELPLAICDTCAFVFEKLKRTPSLAQGGQPQVAQRVSRLLNDMREMPDELTLAEIATPFAPGGYTAALVRLLPQLISPSGPDDYFGNEAVATWPPARNLAVPHEPQTPYYRVGTADLGAVPYGGNRLGVALAIPLYRPSSRWNRREVIERYRQLLRDGVTRPTALVLGLVEDRGPATWDEQPEFSRHLVVSLFLIDGHHKVLAAAEEGLPVQFLALFPDKYLEHQDPNYARPAIGLLRALAKD